MVKTYAPRAKASFTPLTSQEYDNSGAWGILTSLDIYDCDADVIKDGNAIKKFTAVVCEKLGVKRFGETQLEMFGTDPKVHGYSMVQLIETSLVSGHFAEDTNAVYLDIFSCKFYDAEKLIEYALEFFGGQSYDAHSILRGVSQTHSSDYEESMQERNVVLNSR